MKRSLFFALAITGSLVTISLAQETPVMPRTGMMANRDAASDDPDRAFAAVVISHARMTRECSEYVAQKATNPDVKKLAMEIATEQQQLSDRAMDAAKKAGLTLQTERMLPRDQATLDFMKELPVSSLERMYVFHVAGANETHQLMAQWAAKNAQKPEIRTAASEIASKLEKRGEMIQQLAQVQVNTPRTAGER